MKRNLLKVCKACSRNGFALLMSIFAVTLATGCSTVHEALQSHVDDTYSCRNYKDYLNTFETDQSQKRFFTLDYQGKVLNDRGAQNIESRNQAKTKKKINLLEAATKHADANNVDTIRKDYIYMAQSLIETEQFDKALKICSDGLRFAKQIDEVDKNTMEPSVRAIMDMDILGQIATMPWTNNDSFARRLYYYQAYVAWIKTGNVSQSFEPFDKYALEPPSEAELKKRTDERLKSLTNGQTEGNIFDIAIEDIHQKVKSDSGDRVQYYLDRGIFESEMLGDYPKAQEYLLNALNRAKELSIVNKDLGYNYQFQIYSRLLFLNIKMGHLEVANSYLADAEETLSSSGYKVTRFIQNILGNSKSSYANINMQIGVTYALLHDFEKSEEFFAQAANATKNYGTSNKTSEKDVAGAYNVLYGTYFLGGQRQYEEASKLVDDGIKMITPHYIASTEDFVTLESANILSGELHLLLKNYDLAEQKAETAKDLADRYHNKTAKVAAFALLGEALYRKGNNKGASDNYDRALKLTKGTDNTENWKLFYGLGRVSEDFKDYSSARENYRKAAKEVEKLWYGRFKDSRKQVSFIDNRLIVFEPLIRLAIDRGPHADAVEYMEMSKARTFYESDLLADERIKVKSLANVSKDMIEKVNALNPSIVNVSNRMEKNEERIKEIDELLVTKKKKHLKKSQILALQSETKDLHTSLEKDKQEFDSLNDQKTDLVGYADINREHFNTLRPHSASQIQKMLPTNTVVLEYYIGDNIVAGALISHKRLVVKKLDITPEKLKESVNQYRDLIEYIDPNFGKEGQDLYNAMVKPFEKDMSKFEVVCIIPHGVLHYLPFQALVVHDVSNEVINPDLIKQQRDILMALAEVERSRGAASRISRRVVPNKKSSAPPADDAKLKTQLAQIDQSIAKERNDHGSKEYARVFFGDKFNIFYAPSATILDYVLERPQHRADSLLAVGSPPQLSIKDLNIKDSDGKVVDSISKLEGAKREVLAVAQQYDKKKVYTDEAATETSVRANANKYDVILLSAHGLLNTAEPLQSAIFLNKDSGSNGRLTITNIEGMKTKADLVVLSACETGLVSGYGGAKTTAETKLPYGDDVVGLQRAFMKSGSVSILSTLWKVNDDANAALVENFFKEFKSGKDKVTALALAEKYVRQHGDWDHPYYWAPFLLSGNWK